MRAPGFSNTLTYSIGTFYLVAEVLEFSFKRPRTCQRVLYFVASVEPIGDDSEFIDMKI